MESQPKEIINHIFSYLDNRELTLIRRTCHKWKYLIEKLLDTPEIPPLYVCILERNYYHFAKHYSNYHYDTRKCYGLGCIEISEVVYYANLFKLIGNKFFNNKKPESNHILSNDELLWYSAQMGYLEIVKCLGSQNIYGRREYIAAAGNGHLHVLKYLDSLRDMQDDISIPFSPNLMYTGRYRGIYFQCNNSLKFSVINGHYNVVKYLIDQGSDIHFENDFVLHWSAYHGHLDIVKYLISKGADIHSQNDITLQKSIEKGHFEVAHYLVSHGANFNVLSMSSQLWYIIKSYR